MDALKIITDKAEDLYFRFGIKSISMDDIARNLGMSKKTIYKFFVNKEALVTTILEKQIQDNIVNYKRLDTKKEDTVIQLFFIMLYARELYLRLNGSIIHDLQKYYTGAYEILNNHKNGFIYQAVRQCIADGIRQRLFREDFSILRMSRFFLESIAIVADVNLFSDTDPEPNDLAGEIFGHLICGIVTGEGMELIKLHKTEWDLLILLPRHPKQ